MYRRLSSIAPLGKPVGLRVAVVELELFTGN
jgi:hypothetical protein